MPDPRRRRRKPVKEITDARIGEYSGVDKPATDRDFVMFKSIDGAKADFPGIGSEPGTMPTGGRARDLADLETCLRNHPEWSPAYCEAVAAGEGLDQALEAEMEGDDATVSDPPTAGTFELMKEGQAKPEDVDACVQGLLADPEFSAGDFPDRESRAFAICQSQVARHGGPAMPRKQEIAPEEIVVEGEPMAEPTVEIQTTAVEWPMEQCIVEAKDVLGTDDDGAVAVCSLIRTEFGDMENPEQILIPESMTTEALLQSAAIEAGIAKTSSGGEGKETTPEQPVKFTGQNRWWRWTKAAAGLLRPKSPEQKALERLRQEVTELKQEKSKDRLIQTLLATSRMHARAAGLDTSDLDALAADFGLGTGTPAPATEPAVETNVEEILAEAKRRKDELEGGQRVELEKPIDEMTAEELEALIAKLQGMLGQKPAKEPEGEGEQEPTQEPETVIVVAGTPAAQGAPASDDGAPPEGIALIDPAVVGAPGGKTHQPAQRKSAAPTRGAGQIRVSKSSVFGGAYIPTDDRKALGWKHGV